MHPRWLTKAMPEARIRCEQWFRVKCDGVAKNAVMDPDKDDGRTLRDAVLTEFKDQNSTKDVDCTAMKVNWLSKSYLEKRVGSLVIWLRNKAAADHLLQRGTAVFGASRAFCSEFVRLDNPNLCYNSHRARSLDRRAANSPNRVNKHRATNNYKLNSNIAGVATEIKGRIALGEGS
jgi:hypothetical protein